MRKLAFVLFALAFSASAQLPSEYRRFLVPLTGFERAGANGSLWTTELMLNNTTQEEVRPIYRFCDADSPIITPPCSPLSISPQWSQIVGVFAQEGRDGAFVYLHKSQAEGVEFELRARDVSREAQGWGTEVPVVPVEQFRTTIRLLDLPNDPRYRMTLRIYGADEHPRRVQITVLGYPNNVVLEQREVELAGDANLRDETFPLSPAYAQLDPMTEAIRASGHQRIRIQVTPLTADPIWAFASITNNDTQQVTTVTPHVR